ncbi:biotin carboxylase [Chromobacterium alkanivorans]|uniref:ATP-grasp domain-containing protein n=1 Tax=Chromobacterium TaxID=535 RepID=UPI0006539AD6|nr:MULTISPECIES: ATP-grasp domain-containing protein [Chromobacterium]KMN83663.1 phosphoribosylglycinamide synthetase [Chromobacterium sp. LK11]MCS3804242.1 biotin carboxylase [Chromobacterium alkanivorans]MCS3818538.1 biotin carboxylase [Chromobacterium alkanivorans]MCS3873527.1 biotin carboxylase [Chromobacterium alkanivorans]
MKQAHVLVVGGLDHTLDKLEQLGVRYSMMQTLERVNERQYRAATRYAVMDYEDMEEVLLLARAWHARDPFDAVVSFTEYGLHPASQCAIELGIPGDNLEAVLHTRDKIKMRELLGQHGLSPVQYRVCQSVDDARVFFRELKGEAMVLKPFAGGLSEGVFFVDAEAHLEARWNGSRAVMDGPILAEEFLHGPEYSVESISINGRHQIAMITEKETTALPRFIELGHQVPARLDEAQQAAVKELVTRFLDVIGQKTGPAHTEIRLTPSGPRIIESQTRVGGDQIWEMCEMVSGVNLTGETVAVLTDSPRPERKPVAQAAAIRFFSYENARILDVRGIEQARSAPGVVRLDCQLQAGKRYDTLKSSNSRQGYVLCVGDTIEQAVANAEAARDAVQVAWEPLAEE